MRVYVAGPYRGKTIIDVIGFQQQAREAGAILLAAGHDVYVPHLDFELGITREGRDVTVKQWQANSMSFVWHWAECLVLLPGWRESHGTLCEIEAANERKLPVAEFKQPIEEMECHINWPCSDDEPMFIGTAQTAKKYWSKIADKKILEARISAKEAAEYMTGRKYEEEKQ